MVRSLGIDAYACHPLMIEGQVIGTLSFGSRTKKAFAEDELALMREVTNYVAIAIQRVRLMDSLEAHAESAESANQAKSRVLATMSHEIRTPLSAVLGIADLVLEQPLAKGVHDDVQTIRESATSLLQLLDEILESARLEAGMVALESVPFDLRSTVAQAVKVLGPHAAEKGLQLVCDFSDGLPQLVVGDPLRLRQVLLNLVANAVKFTANGGVLVRVATEPATPGAADLHFSVSDTGIGISAEEQKRIFAPFAQAEASTARRCGGSGLGLSICRRLLDLMGGRIWLESELGTGARSISPSRWRSRRREISGETPSTESETGGEMDMRPSSGADNGPDQSKPARPLAILLADDAAVGQRVVGQMLSNRGHRAEVARNGQEALDLLRQRHFDAVLMDVEMPGMDGFQATAAIRRLDDAHKARVPIIAMTAHAAAGDDQRCLAAGMDAYLSKPINSAELIHVVERLAGAATVGQAAAAFARPANADRDRQESAVPNFGEISHSERSEESSVHRNSGKILRCAQNDGPKDSQTFGTTEECPARQADPRNFRRAAGTRSSTLTWPFSGVLAGMSCSKISSSACSTTPIRSCTGFGRRSTRTITRASSMRRTGSRIRCSISGPRRRWKPHGTWRGPDGSRARPPRPSNGLPSRSRPSRRPWPRTASPRQRRVQRAVRPQPVILSAAKNLAYIGNRARFFAALRMTVPWVHQSLELPKFAVILARRAAGSRSKISTARRSTSRASDRCGRGPAGARIASARWPPRTAAGRTVAARSCRRRRGLGARDRDSRRSPRPSRAGSASASGPAARENDTRPRRASG